MLRNRTNLEVRIRSVRSESLIFHEEMAVASSEGDLVFLQN